MAANPAKATPNISPNCAPTCPPANSSPSSSGGDAMAPQEEEGSDDADFERAQTELAHLISSVRQRGQRGQRGQADLAPMRDVYLPALGLGEEDLDRLCVIHVAGTKGKGSTCAFVESILRRGGVRTGMFTSPHLVDVRERIRINGEPISKRQFSDLFWEVKGALERAVASSGESMPGYFRFLCLLALKAFSALHVEASVLEVGLGGRLDATNVIPQARAIGITSLGYDHTAILGSTLSEIASEKAGIMRPGQPVWTVSQEPEAMRQLQSSADAIGASLEVCAPLDQLTGEGCHVGVPGSHQRENAALAVSLVRDFAHRSGRSELLPGSADGALPKCYREGVESARWPGRGQVVREGSAAFFLDGAHTAESCHHCAAWFAEECGQAEGEGAHRVLLFHCKGDRDPQSLLAPLANALSARKAFPHSALFPPLEPQGPLAAGVARQGPHVPGEGAGLTAMGEAWEHECRKHGESTQVSYPESLPEAIRHVLSSARGGGRVHVLVTGSLYLVGDVLRILRRPPV